MTAKGGKGIGRAQRQICAKCAYHCLTASVIGSAGDEEPRYSRSYPIRYWLGLVWPGLAWPDPVGLGLA